VGCRSVLDILSSVPTCFGKYIVRRITHKVLSKKSREFLLATMSHTRTGAGRLKGLLPKGTPIGHKTGTIGGVANDVGFITLPDGRRFAIAVFTKSSTTPEAYRDRAIAEVSRTLYDLTAQDK
jgi:beta-lactamase class A